MSTRAGVGVSNLHTVQFTGERTKAQGKEGTDPASPQGTQGFRPPRAGGLSSRLKSVVFSFLNSGKIFKHYRKYMYVTG